MVAVAAAVGLTGVAVGLWAVVVALADPVVLEAHLAWVQEDQAVQWAAEDLWVRVDQEDLEARLAMLLSPKQQMLHRKP